jgi:hypothetical protein
MSSGSARKPASNHSDGQAERFYRDLQQRGIRVRVGMEATGYSRWFERLLAELGFEVWMGDSAEIKAKRVKKQKFDREAYPSGLETSLQAPGDASAQEHCQGSPGAPDGD